MNFQFFHRIKNKVNGLINLAYILFLAGHLLYTYYIIIAGHFTKTTNFT